MNENKRYAYITYQDIHAIPENQSQTVMVVKAPPDAHLEVPQPTNPKVSNYLF